MFVVVRLIFVWENDVSNVVGDVLLCPQTEISSVVYATVKIPVGDSDELPVVSIRSVCGGRISFTIKELFTVVLLVSSDAQLTLNVYVDPFTTSLNPKE